jgi:DNA primase
MGKGARRNAAVRRAVLGLARCKPDASGPIPDTVQELHIFSDNDDAGRLAAERTAHEHRHRRIVVRFPPEQFKDWDDVTRDPASKRDAA